MEISCELFSSVPFPVIVTDKYGKIIYKNESTRKHLPKIRRGAKIAPHLADPEKVLSGTESFPVFANATPYSKAFVFRKAAKDGPYLVFYLFSVLQSGDTEKIKPIISAASEAELFGIKPSDRLPSGAMIRLYGDIDKFTEEMCFSFDWQKSIFDIEDILRPLSSRLGGAFRSRGIRIHTETDRSVARNRYCVIIPKATVFIISRMIYAVSRCTEDGRVLLRAAHSDASNSIEITAATKSHAKLVSGELTDLAPECIFEAGIFASLSENAQPKIFSDGTESIAISLALPCADSFDKLAVYNTFTGFDALGEYINESVSEISRMFGKAKRQQ